MDSTGISLCRLVFSGSAIFPPFNPFGESQSNCSYHIWGTADTSCCATAEESMLINICSLLEGASANIVALLTAWLLGSFSKTVPCYKPCSLLCTTDVLIYIQNSAKWRHFQERIPIYKRGEKVRTTKHKCLRLRVTFAELGHSVL